MNRRHNALLLVTILLTVGLANPVSAWHSTPDPGAPEVLPKAPEEPPTETDIEPVDRNLEETFAHGETVNEEAEEGYRFIGDRLNEVDEDTRFARQPLTLFRDGAGGREASDTDDLLDGGFGDPTLMGTHAWGRVPGAAATGQQGYTTPRNAEGDYPAFSSSLLVTPEIDLRTNFFMEDAGAENVGGDVVARGTDVPSTVYSQTYWACDSSLTTPLEAVEFVVSVPSQNPDNMDQQYTMFSSAACWPYRDLVEATDSYATLEFRQRHNMANGQDAVSVMVFSQPPTVQLAQTCQGNPRSQTLNQATASSHGRDVVRDDEGVFDVESDPKTPAACTVVMPSSAATGQGTYRRGGLATMPDGMGYTGYGPWVTDSIDLTPWTDRSVWVGFYFASGSTGGPSHFGDPAVFNPAAGFNGFHLDDIEVKSPAAQVNIGVRPLESPNCRVDLCRDGIPVLPFTEPVEVVASVTNLGTQENSVTTVTRVLHMNRSVIHTMEPLDATIAPAAYLQQTMQITDLDAGSYILQTCVARNATGPIDSDPDFCEVPRAPQDCTQDSLEADPCHRLVEQRFDLDAVHSLHAGPIKLGSTHIGSSDKMHAGMTITNDGNSDQWVKVKLVHVQLDSPSLPVGEHLLDDADAGIKDILIPKGGSKQLQWNISGTDGDYRLVAQVFDAVGNPVPIRPDYDLVPSLIQPWRAAVFTGDIQVDGNNTDSDWGRFPLQYLDNGLTQTRYQVGNDADDLYIFLRGISRQELVLFFNDLDDADITSGAGGIGLFSDASDVARLIFDATIQSWDEASSWPAGGMDPSESGIEYNWTFNPDGGGTWNAEIKVPISGSAPGGLQAGPGQAVGLMIRHCADHQQSLGCTAFPRGASWTDGGGFHPPDGGMDDEVQQWHPILLADPATVPAEGVFRYAENVISPAFSIGKGVRPPLFFEDFQQCPTFEGWMQQEPSTATFQGAQTKWNCAPYAEDGTPLLYWGNRPGSDCGGVDCLPYAGIPGAPAPNTPETFTASTPPIDIPADAEGPAVILSHQYSTQALIEDRYIDVGPFLGGDNQGRIRLQHVLDLHVDAWDETTESWVDQGALVPQGGFPTEASTGILDPRYPPRQFYEDAIYADPICGALPSSNPPDWVPACNFIPSASSWWWPQGEQVQYRPLDREVPVPGDFTFHGGSPWTTDVLPLPPDVDGKTIRLRLQAINPPLSDRTPVPDLEDWGWRIGGLAVIEGDSFQHDMTIESATVDLPFDLHELGVAPGSPVPVKVTVRNDGQEEAIGVRVHVVGENHAKGSSGVVEQEVCRNDAKVEGAILAGENRTVTVHCDVHDDATGLLALRASVERGDVAESFHGNDHFRVRGHFDISTTEAAVIHSLSAVPSTGPVGESRPIQVRIQNQGNVPLEGAEVTLKIFNINDPSKPPVEEYEDEWVTTTTLPIQKSDVALEDLVDDLDIAPHFTPRLSGLYLVQATLRIPETGQVDTQSIRFQATDEVYSNGFDQEPVIDRVVMGDDPDLPDPAVWNVRKTGGWEGSARLTAGDPASGEILPGSDASFVLPEIDLSMLKDGTLTFRHRYDLESGYDAARVEMSVDGGKTWRLLRPEGQIGNDLPQGYPSKALVGANPILGDEVDCFACAFTGRSMDIPGNDDGWISTEIDLTRQTGFWSDTPIDAFPLDGRASVPRPSPFPSVGGPQFTHETWTLDEPGAVKNQRYWWIDDLTYSTPTPLTDGSMWWSGSAGVKGFDDLPPVDTSLQLSVPSTWTIGSEDRLLLQYWDWRSGWQDSADGGRIGTGADFLAEPLVDGFNDHLEEARIVEKRPDGWTLREVDLSKDKGSASFGINFTYISGTADDAPREHHEDEKPYALLKNNRGWFIDSVRLVQQRADGGEEVLFRDTARALTGSTVSVREGDVEWRAIRLGGSSSGVNWRIDSETVPGQGEVPVWRLQDETKAEGYPANVDSRVVTPVVDLRGYRGDTTHLRFDHRYSFIGLPHTPAGTVGRATDAGAVEVQVFDDATGTYGPWQLLAPEDGYPEMGFRGEVTGGGVQVEDPARRSELAAAEHPAFVFASSPEDAPFDPAEVDRNDIRLVLDGNGPAGAKVGDRRDLGDLYPAGTTHFPRNIQTGGYFGVEEGGQALKTSWRIRWTDWDGDGAFGPGDGAFLDLSGPVEHPDEDEDPVDHPGDEYLLRLVSTTDLTGYTGEHHSAGTWVDKCNDSDHPSGQIDCKGSAAPTLRTAEPPGSNWADAVRWADLDGDGVWSGGDAAYIQADSINDELTPSDSVAVDDLRLNRLDPGRPEPALVRPSDDDVGAPLQPGGRFDICRTGTPRADPPPFPPLDKIYIATIQDCGLDQATRSPQLQFKWFGGIGASFPTTPGWFAPEGQGFFGNRLPELQFHPLLPFNYTPVFSGDSGGWVQSDMDISHLIGKQVRFAFHAWTNPSAEPAEPCTSAYDAGCTGLHGWSIGNVAIQGQQFDGSPVLVRFRVATDESMPKGEWSIDDINILGQRHQNRVTIQTNSTSILDEPGSTVTFEGTVRNLGAQPRNGLVLSVDAQGTGDFTIIEPQGLGAPDPTALPPEFRDSHVIGPFDMAEGDSTSSTLPVRIDVELPGADGGAMDLHLTVLEDVGECTTVDGETTCEPRYVPVRNERGTGPAVATWHAEGRRVVDPEFTAPWTDRDTLLVADPASTRLVDTQGDGEQEWQTVTFHAAIQNNGTDLPDDLNVHWTVQEILRKGDPNTQVGTRAETRNLGPRATETQEIPQIDRAEVLPIQWQFTLDPENDGPGLYELTLQLTGTGMQTQTKTLEFVAGEVSSYYSIDFAHQSALSQGWQAAQPQGPEAYGQTPAEIAFRQEQGRFIWGVNQTQSVGEGLNYCTLPSGDPCNPPSTTRNDAPGSIYGLHGVAEGPLVPLGKVVGDQAVLSLRNGHVFADRDGGVVEALPVRYPVHAIPQPAFVCQNIETGDPAPMWFQLAPASGSTLGVQATGYPAKQIQTGPPPPDGMHGPPKGWTPQRVNPVDIDGAGPAIGGPGVDEEVTRFTMDDPAPICPPGYAHPDEVTPPSTLVNYTLQLRLRAGTTPGLNQDRCTQFMNDCRGPGETQNPPLRAGAVGWQIDSIGITSGDVRLSPSEGRTLPVLDGLRKTFNIQVSNHGPLPETFRFGLADGASSTINATWFDFPEPSVELAPGQTKTVPFEVYIPAGTFGAGSPIGHLQVTSGLDPNIFDRVKVELVLPENPLPDLWTGLDIQTDTEVPEPGKVTRVVTTIHNVGQREADAVPVLIQATLLGEDGQDVSTTTIATKQLPRLGPDEVKAEVAEWTPRQPGIYRIDAIADPEGKLVEGNLGNSRAEALVQVLPPDRPLARFTELTFEGVGSDGYALEGSLVTINATLKNTGDATANGGRVFLWAGTTQLTEKTIEAISPGDSTSISAVRVASAGETKVRAIYIPTNGQEDPNEMSRILRVRGLDLSYEAPTDTLSFTPGDTLTTQVNVTNDGNAVEKVVFTLGPDHDGWALAATPNPVTIAPEGGTAWSILTLQAPEDAVAGTYDVFVLAAPQSRPDVPQDVAVPVIVASDIRAPTMDLGNATGAPGTMSVPVTLQSTSNAPQDMQVSVSPADWLPRPFNLTLQPGVQEILDLAIQVPGTTPSGNQTLKVIVKDLQNTTLTQAESTIRVLPKESGTAAWGGNRTSRTVDMTSRVFSIDLDFTNTGNLPVRPYVTLSRLTAGAESVPTEPMEMVPPGATVHLPVAVRVDQEFGAAVTGQAAVFMEVASAGDNADKDVLVGQLAIPDLGYLPDLAVKDVKVSPRGVVGAGDPVSIEVTFENLGRVEAPATNLYAYVNGETVNVYDVQALQAGESVQINLTWAFPVSGEYLVHLVADGDAKVVELHDDNNGWTQDLTVEPGSLFQQAKEAPALSWPFLAVALAASWMVARRRRQ